MKRYVRFATILLLVGLYLARPALAYAAGTTITVNTTDGTGATDGLCSFPEAVQAANTGTAQDGGACPGGTGPYTIAFNIGGGGAQTITATSSMVISVPMLIDGTTQPGYSGTPLIRVDGNNTEPEGVFFSSGSEGSLMKGLMVTRFTFAQVYLGAGNATSHVTLTGNYIGTDGTNALGGMYGVAIIEGLYNQIGGPAVTDRNVIAGSSQADVAIYGSGSVSSDHNVVQGNYLGTNAAGTAAVGSTPNGVFLSDSNSEGASNNLVTSNLISGHTQAGVNIIGQYNNNNVVQNNYIGTNASGTSAIGNYAGIELQGGSNNIIGGNGNLGRRNLISGNFNGIEFTGNGSTGTVIKDNVIGMNAGGNASLGNTQFGIYLSSDPVASVESNWIAGSPAGIYLDGPASITSGINNCLTGNTNFGLNNTTGSGMTFTNNWWGAASGPYNATGNPGGTGNAVSDNVTFSPFATAPEPICAPNASLNGTSLSFGNQLVGTTSALKSVTLTNTGTAPLHFTSLHTALPFSLDPSTTCQAASPLAPRATCKVTVKFAPSAIGAASKTVGFASDAFTAIPNINLSGTGVAGTQLLKNPDFETDANNDKKPDNWTFANFNSATDGRDCTIRKSGTCSLKLAGNNTAKTAVQTIVKSGVAGDDFTFSLWSRAASVPSAATYKLTVTFYNGSTVISTKTLNFTKGTHSFLNVSGTFTAPGVYTKIVYTLTFKAASGTAWFDLAALNWAH